MGSVRRRVAEKLRQVRGSGGEPAWSAERNIVITGPGRSGTTLTCHLLNKLPNTVALSEPINPGKYADRLPDNEAVADAVVKGLAGSATVVWAPATLRLVMSVLRHVPRPVFRRLPV